MSKPYLEELYAKLAPILEPLGQVYIAGGAVRDALMGRDPKDFDIFLLTAYTDAFCFDQKRAALAEALSRAHYSKAELRLEWHKSEPYLLESIIIDGHEIQIMVNFSADVYELVSNFDWNVSLFAYGFLPKEGQVGYYKGEDINNIKPGEFLKLNKVTYPYSTLRRGYRFSERFQMRLKAQDIRLICSKILENKQPEPPPQES